MRTRMGRFPAAVVAMFAATVMMPDRPATAAEEVRGAGSTWSQIAVDQWRADVARQGLSINYQGLGSTTGRSLYYNDQVDFAVSEIPFQTTTSSADGSVTTNEVEKAAHRPYAYLPVVAGGTSFMYHVAVGGTMLRDIKLSGPTLARIFTGRITNWNDPQIVADNAGRALPDLKIIPVIRSDGSGTTAQFTAWMASQFGDIWNEFCRSKGLPTPCPATSQYPEFAGSRAQQYSDGVANYVSAPYNNGAITYVEYGYADARSFPVASVLNAAGFYVQPTAENVAIALLEARINPDRTQVLAGVYTNRAPRAYPVSSYSYMIVPTSTAQPFTAAKGETLGRFILYLLCAGQQKAKQLGYSPLPRNLVQFGFDALREIPGAPAPPPIEQCANPTITGNFIENLENAAPPPESARRGAQPDPSAATAAGAPGASAQAGSPANPQAGSAAARTAAAKTAAATSTATAARTASRSAAGPAPGSAAGAAIAGGEVALEAVAGDAAPAPGGLAAPVVSVKQDDRVPAATFVLAAVLFLLVVFLPPGLAAFAGRGSLRRQ